MKNGGTLKERFKGQTPLSSQVTWFVLCLNHLKPLRGGAKSFSLLKPSPAFEKDVKSIYPKVDGTCFCGVLG